MTYYIAENNERRGPFTLEQLATMNITADTLVWGEGMDTWKKVDEVEVLRALLISRNAAKSSAEGETLPLRHEQEPPELPRQQKSWISRHVGLAVFIALIAALIASLWLTCPKKEAHQEALSELTNDVVKDEMNKLTGGPGTTIAQKLFTGVVENFFDDAFTTHDYKLFSLTRFDAGSHNDIVAVGVFGHVFTANKEVVTKYVEKEIKKQLDSQITNLKRFLPSNLFKELYDTFVGGLINEFIGETEEDTVNNSEEEI